MKPIFRYAFLTGCTIFFNHSFSQNWSLTGNAGTSVTTNFLGTRDNQALVFRTNNIERMRISKGGKVGIGTANPKAALHVTGSKFVSLSSPGYLMLGNEATNNMALDVNQIQARYNGGASSLFLNYNGGNTYIGYGSDVYTGYGGGNAYICYGGGIARIGKSGNGLQVNTDGTVGIKGPSSSSYALNVNTSSALAGIRVTDPVNNQILYSSKSGTGYGIYVRKTNTSDHFATIYCGNAGGEALHAFSGAGDAVYGSTSAADSVTAGVHGSASNLGMGVWGEGNYGYGVYGLSNRRDGVYGFSYSTSGVHGMCSSDGYGVWGESVDGTGVFGHSANSTGVEGRGGSPHGNGVSGYAINSAGLYGHSENGLGLFAQTSNPSEYAGWFTGSVYTSGSYYEPSDLKLKQSVKDFTGAMDVIKQLHPKQYQYRQDGNYKQMNFPQGNRYGLIAEDVEKVLPGLVKQTKYQTRGAEKPKYQGNENFKMNSNNETNEKSETIEFKALNYIELIPILIKGMQEQQNVIDKQQEQIKKQEIINDKLQQQINELKRLLSNSGISKSSSEINAAYLKQNAPNPFTNNTVISCYVPANVGRAQLVIYDQQGRQLQAFTLNNKGQNELIVSAGTLPSGKYVYTLFADGKIVDSKNMILTK